MHFVAFDFPRVRAFRGGHQPPVRDELIGICGARVCGSAAFRAERLGLSGERSHFEAAPPTLAEA
jgi:hypothetical protein